MLRSKGAKETVEVERKVRHKMTITLTLITMITIAMTTTITKTTNKQNWQSFRKRVSALLTSHN